MKKRVNCSKVSRVGRAGVNERRVGLVILLGSNDKFMVSMGG